MTKDLFEILTQAATKGAAALRCRQILQPAAGQGGKVFPPTYQKKDSKKGDPPIYAQEVQHRKHNDVKVVLLDSVQSQANRIEQALLSATREEIGPIKIPYFYVDIPDHGRITTFDAPHRVFDAIFRDSILNGENFFDSEIGKKIKATRLDDATTMFRYCPAALLLGVWNSTTGEGVRGFKLERALVSEIIGVDVRSGAKTSSRLDPLQLSVGTIFKDKTGRSWTIKTDEALTEVKKEAGEKKKEKKDEPKFVKYGKEGKLSELNHGNVTPTATDPERDCGGVTMDHAEHTAVISFPQLRRLRFPGDKTNHKRDVAGRTVLACLGLYGLTCCMEYGYDLRSRCLLVPEEPAQFELVGASLREITPLDISADMARELLIQALKVAADNGLEWAEEPIELTPSQQLLDLVNESKNLGLIEVDQD